MEQKIYKELSEDELKYLLTLISKSEFIGKDLQTVTQQKLLQALGRIGRNNIQQDYTIRFRDDNLIKMIFTEHKNNIEAKNMCSLFNSN